MDFLKMLFGSAAGGKGAGFFGGDAFKNLAGLGTNLWQGMQQNKMLNFQKDMAQQSFGMQKEIHNENKEDRNFRRNVDLGFG